jgi:hypothetical protein
VRGTIGIEGGKLSEEEASRIMSPYRANLEFMTRFTS